MMAEIGMTADLWASHAIQASMACSSWNMYVPSPVDAGTYLPIQTDNKYSRIGA